MLANIFLIEEEKSVSLDEEELREIKDEDIE